MIQGEAFWLLRMVNMKHTLNYNFIPPSASGYSGPKPPVHSRRNFLLILELQRTAINLLTAGEIIFGVQNLLQCTDSNRLKGADVRSLHVKFRHSIF